MSVYKFEANTIDGEKVSLEGYKGKVLIIANTASKCGFTPQYKDLQKLYEKYKEQGLEILGFPCNQFGEQEPGTNSEVKNFCELNYGVDFMLRGLMLIRYLSILLLMHHSKVLIKIVLPVKCFMLL